jgi:mannose-6-phosphate isomerase
MIRYPLRMQPTYHVKVWGGRKLETVLGKTLPSDETYGEAWELHDSAAVANGPLAGRTMGDLLAEYGADVIGTVSDPAEGLPLLAKLIDAADWLSIQLHPDDAQAQALEGQPRGKTEAWYILAAEPGSRLVIGVQPGTMPDQMAAAIRSNTLEDLLVVADVVPGDVLFVQAGTIHAIGAGILLYEIQQSSDTTYRLYDWGRLGLDGQPRPLHIEKGTQVANLESLPQIIHTGDQTGQVVEIVSAAYFVTRLYQLNARNGDSVLLDTGGDRFHVLTCIEGTAAAAVDGETVDFTTGQTVLIPAAVGGYTLSGPGRVLWSAQP